MRRLSENRNYSSTLFQLRFRQCLSFRGKQTNGLCLSLLLAFLISIGHPAQARTGDESKPVPTQVASTQDKEKSPFRSYEVNKKISEFPADDFSTPEAAAAVITRLITNGGSEEEWKHADYLHRSGLGLGTRKPSPEVTQMYLDAVVREVSIYKDRVARVLTEVKHPSGKVGFDQRYLILVEGRWLNTGHDGEAESLEAARSTFIRKSESIYRSKLKQLGEEVPGTKRPPIENPDAYLKPFVDFLKEKGEDPRAFALKALAGHKLTILGEVHHRPRYWAFNASLVEDPGFPEKVGTIYMELPSNDQDLIDQFLLSKELRPDRVIEMLRDNLWMGWPDQAMLDFFVTVWKTNQNLSPEKRLRIVLVDMQRPWKKIQKRDDWKPYEVDRDRAMADNILSDLKGHPEEKRNALFIVGHGHVKLNMKMANGEPLNNDAGAYLRQALGTQSVYAFFPHKPVMTNMGQVDGRLCLGLFDSAFAAQGNKPVAFPLTEGPFGDQPYDAEPDDTWAIGKYGEGYSAYLYLGSLEDEIFSPLIEGFYDDNFTKELERRTRIMDGKPWHELYGYEATNPKNVIEWMSGKNGTWGKPRKWTSELGPTNAWIQGDDWERKIREKKQQEALKQPGEVVAAANRIFKIIQDADYRSFKDFSGSVHDKMNYMTDKWLDVLYRWMYDHFKDNPIQSVKLGEVSESTTPEEVQKEFGKTLPTVHYKLALKDGSVLEGDLYYYYDPRTETWNGYKGLDWHLK
jgi:hypothetical protein